MDEILKEFAKAGVFSAILKGIELHRNRADPKNNWREVLRNEADFYRSEVKNGRVKIPPQTPLGNQGAAKRGVP